MKVSTIGLDIAKSVFHVVTVDARGDEVAKKQLKRAKVLEYFANLEPCLVGIETCGGAHYWARELEKLGYTVKLMSPKAVKAYRSTAKNDYNDARAIAEAATRQQVRAIPIKSAQQLDAQAVHRARELVKKQRNQIANSMRGFLAEHGIVVAKSLKALRQRVPELLEDAENELSDTFRELLNDLYHMLGVYQGRLADYDQRLRRVHAVNPHAQLIAHTPGVGVVTATAVTALHGNLSQFRRSEDFSAAVGLVPRQDSTGGKTVLLGINKKTNPYLRTLFIHGARSVLRNADKHTDDPLCRWALRLCERRGSKIAAVALANKLARITWAVMNTAQPYCPETLRARST